MMSRSGPSEDLPNQRRVEVAVLEAHPRLVERPRPVHLDVRLLDRGPRTDGVETGDEGEGRADQVVTAARHGESDLLAGDARALDGLGDHRHEHLDLVALVLAADVGQLGEGDHSDVAHHTYSL